MQRFLVGAVLISFLFSSPALAVNHTCFTGGAGPDASFDIQPASSSVSSTFQVRVFQYANLIYNPNGNISGWSHGTDAPYGDGSPYPTNNASYTLANLYPNGFSMPLNGTYTVLYSKQVGYDQINPGGNSATLASTTAFLQGNNWTYCTAEAFYNGNVATTTTSTVGLQPGFTSHCEEHGSSTDCIRGLDLYISWSIEFFWFLSAVLFAIILFKPYHSKS